MADFVRVMVHDRVGWIEYDQPPVNAFHREVPEALEEYLADPAVRVVVSGSALQAHVSVGADLRVFADMDDEGVRRWVDVCHDLVRMVRASPKPLLAAVHGSAVGGGLEMVLHRDVRFAARSARLGRPETGIGSIPPVGATQPPARATADSREGLDAFLGRRPPVWSD